MQNSPSLPTKAQLQRWSRLRNKGHSFREIERLETAAGRPVSYSKIRRGLASITPATTTPRVRLCTMDRVAQCHELSERLCSIALSTSPLYARASLLTAAKQLRAVHLGMTARDAALVVRQTQRDVLAALGFPRL